MSDENNNTQNGEIIEGFVLPRLDWYDEEGRIYKDALIENFNAIEAKLLQISKLSAFQKELPNISSINFPDVTMEDDDNRIINLKSFLEMTDIIGYPLELVTSGKTIKKICYWGSDHKYHQLLNKTVSMGKVNCYVYLNYTENRVFANDSEVTPADCTLIGCYTDGVIKNVNSYDYLDVNTLYYLANMHVDTLNQNISNTPNWSFTSGIKLGNGTIGSCESNRERNQICYFTRYGRKLS